MFSNILGHDPPDDGNSKHPPPVVTTRNAPDIAKYALAVLGGGVEKSALVEIIWL